MNANYIPPITFGSKLDGIVTASSSSNTKGGKWVDDVGNEVLRGYDIKTNSIVTDGQVENVYSIKYNGHTISLNELPPNIYEQVAGTIIDIQEGNYTPPSILENVKDAEEPVITNIQKETVPSPENNLNDIVVDAKNLEKKKGEYNIFTREVKKVDRKPNPNNKKYKWSPTGGWKHKGKENYERDLASWKKRQRKNPTQLRDDNIYRSAVPGGPVQLNMIKNGYIPN